MVFDLDAEKINPLMALSPPDCEPTPLSLRVKAPSVFTFNVRKARLTLPEISGNPAPLCAPATKLSPSAQFRKDCWLFQKSSFDRRLWAYKKFFRNWGLESGNEAGEWGRDEIRNLTGELTWSLGGFRPGSATGTFKVGSRTNQYGADYQTGPDGYSVMFDASNDFQTGPQNVPQHVWQPICLYLGRPA